MTDSHTNYPVDENGCFTLPNGECVSGGPCLHSPIEQEECQPMPPQQDVVYRVAPVDITEGPFFLTPHIEQEECPLEYQFCRHCGEHAIFIQDYPAGAWLSECCDARPKTYSE